MFLDRWFGDKSIEKKSVRPTAVERRGDEVIVDVCGQTCPGYLLAINHAVDPLPRGSRIKLLITYPPCGDDIGAWCGARGITFVDMAHEANKWVISLKK